MFIAKTLILTSFLVALQVEAPIPMAANGPQIPSFLRPPINQTRQRPNTKTLLCLLKFHTCLQEFSTLHRRTSSLFHPSNAFWSGSIFIQLPITASTLPTHISTWLQMGLLSSTISVPPLQPKHSHRPIS